MKRIRDVILYVPRWIQYDTWLKWWKVLRHCLISRQPRDSIFTVLILALTVFVPSLGQGNELETDGFGFDSSFCLHQPLVTSKLP